MMNGKEMRKQKLNQRDGLSEEERAEKSKIIEEKILGIKEVVEADNIFIYVSFRSEVSTLSLINKLMDRGKEISVPITHVREKRMDAIAIDDLAKDLTPGYCSILEPREEKVISCVTDPNVLNVVIVPGSVFDERGGRFGYGGGYYDRFLEKIPGAARIGLAFEVQMVQKAPIQEHDELLDYVVTEKRIITGRDDR